MSIWKHCLFILLLLLASPTYAATATANLSVNIVAGGPAVDRASTFISKFGSQYARPYFTDDEALPMFNQLKVKTLRIGAWTQTDFQRAQYWAAHGFKMHLMFESSNLPEQTIGTLLGWLKTYLVTPYPGKVTSVGGPNETNLQGQFYYGGLTDIAAANKFQHDLFVGIHGDPAFAGINVAMWPLGNPWVPQNISAVGNQTVNCDMADVHGYLGADNLHQPYDVFGPQGTVQVGIQGYFDIAKQVCNRPIFINSEWGWCTPLGANCPASINGYTNEYVHGRIALISMIEHAKRADNKGAYIFTLCCGAPEPTPTPNAGGWYALFHWDHSPKPAAIGIGNFITIVDDVGATADTFTPTSFNYTLSGMPAAGRSYVVAKSNGYYDLIIWNNTSIWNQNNDTQIAIANNAVTVTLPRSMSGAVYNPINGLGTVQTITNTSSVSITLNDAPLIVEVH